MTGPVVISVFFTQDKRTRSRARADHWQRQRRCQRHKHGLEAGNVVCCESRHFMKQAMRPPRCFTFMACGGHLLGVLVCCACCACCACASLALGMCLRGSIRPCCTWQVLVQGGRAGSVLCWVTETTCAGFLRPQVNRDLRQKLSVNSSNSERQQLRVLAPLSACRLRRAAHYVAQLTSRG
jgi:hypothetical protein